jgi:hypothetical protein
LTGFDSPALVCFFSAALGRQSLSYVNFNIKENNKIGFLILKKGKKKKKRRKDRKDKRITKRKMITLTLTLKKETKQKEN